MEQYRLNEKVTPKHPDKIADRIAGAIVDFGYRITHGASEPPRIAVEVLIGHNLCTVIIEASVLLPEEGIEKIIKRIGGADTIAVIKQYQQDSELRKNANECTGDMGIFTGRVLTPAMRTSSFVARDLYTRYKCEAKIIVNHDYSLCICAANPATAEDILKHYPTASVNPLGDWTGGINVDTGATNRKLGSDMGSSISGGGLHGKDAMKPDVAANIFAFQKAQELQHDVILNCNIGWDKIIDAEDRTEYSFAEIQDFALEYIQRIGGFERFAEWGLY